MNHRKVFLILLCAMLVLTGAVAVAVLAKKPKQPKGTETNDTAHTTNVPAEETPVPTFSPSEQPEADVLYVLTERQDDLGTVTYDYDAYGRCIRIASKLDTDKLITIDYAYENGEPVTTVSMETEFARRQEIRKYNLNGDILQQDIITYRSVVSRDGMNLPGGETVSHTRYQSEDGGRTMVQTEFDQIGNPLRITVTKKDSHGNPIAKGRWDSLSGTEYTGPEGLTFGRSNPCDSQGRVTEIYSPLSSDSNEVFLNVKVTYLDDGSRTQSTYDIYGHETDRYLYNSNDQMTGYFYFAGDGSVSVHMSRSPINEAGGYLETTTYFSAPGVIRSEKTIAYNRGGRILYERYTDESRSEYRTVTYLYDEADRLLKVEDTQSSQPKQYQYDENGNLISKTERNTTYSYEKILLPEASAAERTKFYFDKELLQ